MANKNTGIGRFGQTFLSKEFEDYAVNDELLINKTTGRIFYKNIIGEVIDIFDRYASNISEDRIDEIEAALERILQIVSANGPAKMVHFKYKFVAETESQTDFEIPLVTFNKTTDFMILNINTTTPVEGTDYTIVNERTIRLNGGVPVGTPLFVVVFKNIPQVDGDGEFSGNILKNDSVPMEKLAPDVQRMIQTGGSGGGGTCSQFVVVSEELPVVLPLGSMWIQAQGINPPLQTNEIIFAATQPSNIKDGGMWFEIIEEGGSITMAGYSGRIGLMDLDPKLRAIIESLLAGGNGGGDTEGGGTTESGTNVVIGQTKPGNLPTGSYWVETNNFTPTKDKDINFVLSETAPENLEDGDVWIQVVEKGLGNTFLVMNNAYYGKNEPEKSNIWLDPIDMI